MELEYIWEDWVKAAKLLQAVSFVQIIYINIDLSAIGWLHVSLKKKINTVVFELIEIRLIVNCCFTKLLQSLHVESEATKDYLDYLVVALWFP